MVRPQKDARNSGFGDKLLYALSIGAAVSAMVVLAAIGWRVLGGSTEAWDVFGIDFLTDTAWVPNAGNGGVYGAGVMIYGTIVTSAMALVIALPVGVAIGLYLSELAPKSVARVVGPLVEMLAAVPSVIVGFWGVLVLAPFVQSTIEPFLHDNFGFIPLFGEPQTNGSSLFTAGLVLAIMVLPIVASISRDLFLTVPREMKDGAEALGATHWEIVRGIDLPSCSAGIASAGLLALGRALGEAIAVTQVIGAGTQIHTSLFMTGDTLASRIATQFPGAVSDLHISSMYYLAAILLVIGVIANLGAIWIAKRFDVSRMAT